MRHHFNQCVIWLTGASSGIGAALAQKLAATECRLIISARNVANLEKVAALCKNKPFILPLDVTDLAATKSAANDIALRYGRLDIVIFNAGASIPVDMNHFEAYTFERMMQVNFLSGVYGVEAALPLLKKSKEPHIVLMSSAICDAPYPSAEAYGASKAAVKHFGDSLRVHLVAAKIAVSVIAPGFVKTPLTAKKDFPAFMALSADQAANYIFKGIRAYKLDIRFPPLLFALLWVLNRLPKRVLLKSLYQAYIRRQD